MRKVKAVSVLIVFEIAALIAVVGVIIALRMLPVKEDGTPTYVPRGQAAAYLTEADDFERPVDLMADEDLLASTDLRPVDIPAYLSSEFSSEVIERLFAMSTEEKAAQLLMASPEELTGDDLVTGAYEEMEEAFQDLPIAGLIFTNTNFETTSETRESLAAISEYSKNATGFLPFLVLNDGNTSISAMSNQGYNMYQIPIGRNDAAALLTQATDNGMLPVYTGALASLSSNPDYNSSVAIANVESAQEIAESIISGNTFLYRTVSLNRTFSNLVGLIEDGEISEEELNLAVGHIISLKFILEDMQY